MTTTTTTTPGTLRERAIAKYEQACLETQEENTRREADKLKNNLESFTFLLERNLGLGVTPTALTIEYDGCVLRYFPWQGDRREMIVLVGKCERCGDETYSYHINSLSDLGRALADSNMTQYHRCETTETPRPQAEPPPTTEQRLVAVLNELITERINEGTL